MQGGRGEAHRLGTKKSGMVTLAASWDGGVRVTLRHVDGAAVARVELVPHHGRGVSRLLYEGPVDKAAPSYEEIAARSTGS